MASALIMDPIAFPPEFIWVGNPERGVSFDGPQPTSPNRYVRGDLYEAVVQQLADLQAGPGEPVEVPQPVSAQ